MANNSDLEQTLKELAKKYKVGEKIIALLVPANDEEKTFLVKTKAIISTFLQKRNFKKMHEKSKSLAPAVHLLGTSTDPKDITLPHPHHAQRMLEFGEAIGIVKTKLFRPGLRINFGDSMSDFQRKELTFFDLILSIAGSWSGHIKRVIEETAVLLKDKKVDFIGIGTLGGNPTLAYQSPDWVRKEAKACLDFLRKKYPKAKIAVYGLPPTYNINAIQNYLSFDLFLYEWVKNDSNAVFISFKKLADKTGILPSTRWSSEGVHLTPESAVAFNDAFDKAAGMPPKSIVFVEPSKITKNSEYISGAFKFIGRLAKELFFN